MNTSPWRRVATAAAAVVLATPLLSTVGASAAPPPESDRVAVAPRTGRPLVIAHRGASDVAPENTLPAVRAAARAGADLVELDVQRTRDHHLVVVHDQTFARTTNVAQVFPGRQDDPIASFTWAQVRRLDAGLWFSPQYAGTRVPSLQAVLRTLRPTATGVLVELKNPALYPGYERQVASVLSGSGLVAAHRVWVHSFDAAALESFHDLAPSVPVGLIDETGTVPARDAGWLSTLNTTTAATSAADVRAAATAGVRVLSWPTAGHSTGPAEIDRLVDDGVTGIITDRPRAALQALARSGDGQAALPTVAS